HGRDPAHLGRRRRPDPPPAAGDPHRDPHQPRRRALPPRAHPPDARLVHLTQKSLMPLRPWRHAGTVTALTVAAGLLAACGSAEPTSGAPTRADDGHYPVTIENCGDEVTFEAEPRNVV